jgi:hypothetical protein
MDGGDAGRRASESVVVNAGPLIALGKLGLVHLLAQLYGEVLVPPAVYREVVVGGIVVGAADALAVQRAVLWSELVLVRHDMIRLDDTVFALPLEAWLSLNQLAQGADLHRLLT